jgi:hypothetical protein
MANPPSDRDEMRKELHDLAKLAKETRRELNYFTEVPDYRTSGESSGFVDLSAFNASDPKWVEQELARTRAAAAEPLLPPPAPRAIDQLTAESLSPVDLASLLEQDEVATQSGAVGGARRKRGLVFVIGGVAAACLLLVGAALVKGGSPDSTAQAASPTTAPADVAAARRKPSPPAVAAHRTDVMRDTPASRGAAVAVSVPATNPQPAPSPAPAPRRWSAPPAAPPAVAAAPKRDRTPPKPSLAAVVVPPSKPAAADPLVAAIQQSIAPKKGKR